jgi:hypothetical protein
MACIGTQNFQGQDGSCQYCEWGGSDGHKRTADLVGYLLARLGAGKAVTTCHCKDTSTLRNVVRCLELGRIL